MLPSPPPPNKFLYFSQSMHPWNTFPIFCLIDRRFLIDFTILQSTYTYIQYVTCYECMNESVTLLVLLKKNITVSVKSFNAYIDLSEKKKQKKNKKRTHKINIEIYNVYTMYICNLNVKYFSIRILIVLFVMQNVNVYIYANTYIR